jgi:hypothetical protein
MPAWSDEFGGPLRPDQIHDIAQYILNFEATAKGEVVIEGLPTPTPRPEDLNDPVARGRQVYLDRGCGGCHTLEGLSVGIVGPGLTQIGTVAATRVPGQSAEEYIHESILDRSTRRRRLSGQHHAAKLQRSRSPERATDLVAFLLAQQ